MQTQQNFKNGGFPPIKYCSTVSVEQKQKKSKERFFSNNIKQNINVRQLLSETTKKPIIITEPVQDDALEVIDSI
jgi:hypothetical protein